MDAGYVNCGCCAGLEWGVEYPRECRHCGGSGRLYRYESGALALWYGGPLSGREDPAYPRPVVDVDARQHQGSTPPAGRR